MRLKNIALILIAVLISGIAASQGEIDYKDRSMLRKLKRNDISTDLQPMAVSPDVSGQDTTRGRFFMSHAQKNVSQNKYIYVGRVHSCRAGGCSSPGMGSFQGNSEYFDYIIVFNAEKKVELVRVFNYQATHGYEITARGWLRQFNGYEGSKDLALNKNIDGLTGATISAEGITKDVERVSGILRSLDVNSD